MTVNDQPSFPASIIEAAETSQASLDPLLVELRGWHVPFLDGPSPAHGDRWIDEAAPNA